MSVEIKPYLKGRKKVIDQALGRYMFRAGGDFEKHIEAMRYSLFAGGKRVRPILCLAAAQVIAGEENIDQAVLPIACALECVHTYSLIHDDLPAMDDDALRRGKPTNHTVFGEAQAILAGDGLQAFAFDLLSNPDYNTINPKASLEIVFTIARAAGPLGMVGGQSLDVANEGKNIPFELLRTIHRSKTGALITASVTAGCIAAGATGRQRTALTDYGDAIGLAFQIVDDLLNVESTTEQLGKAAGSDVKRGKATYPAFFGIEKSREMADDTINTAINGLQVFGAEADPLRALAHYVVKRKK